MPTVFKRKGTLPEVNSWNALYNRASGNSLWSNSTFSGLDNPMLQANYIALLASNTKSLEARLPADFDYASPNTQYSVLATLNAYTQEELKMSDEEYATIQENKYNQAFNQGISSDKNFQNYSGINEFVQNNYSGDYSKFYNEYKDNREAFLSPDNLESLSPENYNSVTTESTNEAFDYLDKYSNELSARYSKERDANWSALLNQIEIDKTEYLKKKAWDEASFWEKTGQTVLSYIALPVTEGAELIEGFIDFTAGIAMEINSIATDLDIEGAKENAEVIKGFISKDIIPLNTMIKEALPNSWATSDYTKWYNPAKLSYSVGSSIIDMAPLALNSVVPGLGTAIYYTTSAGKTLENTIQENPDWSINRIVTYTAGATAIEYLTENISGNDIFGPGWFSKYTKIGSTTVGKTVNKALQKSALKMIKEALGEGLEEVVSEFGSNILQGMLTGDFESAFDGFGESALQSFVIGAASGAVISAGSSLRVRNLINRVHKQITTSDGSTITLTMAQSVVVDNFMSEMDSRLAKGIKLSTKNQERYDALKRLNITDMDEAAAKSLLAAARKKSYLNMRGKITYTVTNQIDTTTGANIESVVDTTSSSGYSTEYSDSMFNNYTVAQETSISVNSALQYRYYDASENIDQLDTLSYSISDEVAEKLSTEVSILLALQENSLIKQFGQEAVTNGLKLFNDYSIKTIDDIIKLNSYKRLRKTKTNQNAIDELVEAFGGGFDIVFTDVSKNDPKAPDGTDIRKIIGQLKYAGGANVQTFVTTKNNLPTVFTYNIAGKRTLFINHSLLESKSFATLTRMITAELSVSHWYDLIKNDFMFKHILDSFITRMNVKNIPLEVQERQLLYIAAFVEDNAIAKALGWADFEAYSALKKYLDNIRIVGGSIPGLIREDVQNVVSSALKTYDSVILSTVTKDEVDNYLKELNKNYKINTEISEQFILNHTSAFAMPTYMHFGQSNSKNAVALMTAIDSFGKQFGFDTSNIKNLSVTAATIKLFDKNSYSKDGLKQLNKSISNYDTGSFHRALSAYLQENFGFSVTADNTIIHNEFIADIINIDKLSQILNTDDDVQFKLSDVITERGRNVLGNNFLDADISLENDVKNTKVSGYFIQNFTTSGSSTIGTIKIFKDRCPLNTPANILTSQSIIDTNTRVTVTIHEIQHAISAMTGLNSSPASLLDKSMPRVLKSILSSNSNAPKLLYNFLSDYNMIDTKVYPDEQELLYTNGKLDSTKVQKVSKNVLELIYVAFDINERISQDMPMYISATSQIGAVATDASFSNRNAAFMLTTKSKNPFLQLFNNLIFVKDNGNVIGVAKNVIAKTKAQQITNNDAVQLLLQDNSVYYPQKYIETRQTKPITIRDIAEIFDKNNLPEDLRLVSTKDYWVSKTTNPDLQNYIRNLSELQFKRYIRQYTGLSLDAISKDYKPKFDVAELGLSKNSNYSGIIAEDVDKNMHLISTANPNAAFSEYNAKGLVLWNAKTHTAIFNFNDSGIGQDANTAAQLLKKWTKDTGKCIYFVNDRMFNNSTAVARYLNTSAKETTAEDSVMAANFDALFDKIADTAIKGPAAVYNFDTIFVTNDGKIFNIDSKGNLLQTIKDTCDNDYLNTIGEIKVNPVSGEAIATQENLTPEIVSLLNSKRVVRLYKEGTTWQAYGKPNILQDNFIKLMRANANNHSYLLEGDIGYDLRKSALVIDNGKIKIEYADNNGNIKGKEVPWKNSKWYSAICSIISKYQLTALSQFKRLGFSDEFIEQLSNYTGRKMSSKTREFYKATRDENLFNGIDHSYILKYINDDTNTELSRNILIANCPDSSAESKNLDWKQNAHIHTVQDAKEYLNAVASYWAAMARQSDSTIYSSFAELREAYNGKINSEDPKYIALCEQMANISNNTGKLTAVLNDDARKSGNFYTDQNGNILQNKIYHNGLDISLIAFSNVKYRMSVGEYNLDVQTVSDTQTGRYKDTEDSVTLSDVAAFESDYGNVETLTISKETSEALSKVLSDIESANKDLNIQSRIDKLQNIINSISGYKLDAEMENRIRNYLETATKALANKTIESLSDTAVQNEVDALDKRLKQDLQLTGQAAVEARTKNEAEYSKFKADRIRNIARYGESGYKKILSTYHRNNFTQMNNITSKFSKFFKQLNSTGNTNSITQQFYNRLMATQVKNGKKLELANQFYDVIQDTLKTGKNTKLSEFLNNTLKPYIYDAIQQGEYNFTGPNDASILGTIDEILQKEDISDNDKAQTLMNIVEGFTNNDNPDENISKEAQIRIEYLIDNLVNTASPAGYKKSFVNIDKLKNILSKTITQEQVNSTISSVKQLDTLNRKKNTELDTTVAERWKAIKQTNYEINYIDNTYNRLIKKYRSLSNSPAVTTEDMQQALRNVYDQLTNTDADTENRNVFFDISRSNYHELAKSYWENNYPDIVEFLKNTSVQNQKADESFTKLYPDKAKIIHNAPAYMNRPELQKILDSTKDTYESYKNRFIKEKTKEYRELRKQYIDNRIEALRLQYRQESNDRMNEARRLWDQNNAEAANIIRRFETSGRALFNQYSTYNNKIQELTSKLNTAQNNGDLNQIERLNAEIQEYTNKLNEILPEYNTINNYLSNRSTFINDYMSNNPLTIPQEFRVDKRSLATYIEDNVHFKTISSSLIKRLNGLKIAYTEFLLSPKTEASIAKLNAEVRTVLTDGRLNSYITGDQNKQLLQISDKLSPIEESQPPMAVINNVLDLFKNAEYIDRSGIINRVIKEQSEQYKVVLENEAKTISDLMIKTPNYENPDNTVSANTVTPDDFSASPNASISIDNLFNNPTDIFNELSDLRDTKSIKPKREESEMFENLDTSDVRMHKTINAPELYAYGVDIRPAFEYVFENKESRTLLGKPYDRQIFNTQEFRKNPKVADIIKNLQTNENAAKKFVEWAANKPSINSEYESRMLILLNIIRTAPELSVETRTAAQEIFAVEVSASARNLGLFKNSGLIPTEELCEIALNKFALDDAEKAEIQRLINLQNKAIETDDYITADQATEDMLKIFEKHKNELDNSINFFTAKTPEERAIRLKNLSNRLTAFRYFSMLSLPATFFTRNVTSNAILTAMDKTATGIGTIAMKGINKFAGTDGQYKFTANKVSEQAKNLTDKLLIKTGLLESILNNTVSKYDTGYDYNKNALEKISVDDLDSTDARVQALNNKLNEKTPFGTGNFGKFLNPIYNKIFGIMDKFDKIAMRKRITEITNRLVSDNFTSDQIDSLLNGDATLRSRFDDFVEYAKLESTKIYLRSMPQVYRSLMSALNKYPVAKVLFSVLAPFPRMLINTTMTALAYSPFGLIKAGLTLAKDKTAFRNLTAAKQFGRAIVGTTGMLLGALLASLGLIKIDEDDEYAGPQLVLFGNFAFSLENISPASLPFIVGASMANESTSGPWEALLASGNTLFDATFIGELINSFGGNKTSVDIISNTFSSYATQFIPSLFRRAAQVIDPYQKDNSGDWKFVKRIISAIPGASLLVNNKIDPYTGEDLTRYTNNNNPWISRGLAILNAVLPMQAKYLKESNIETESEAVDAATTGPASVYTIDGKTYQIPDKQYDEYRRLRAKLYSQYANELISTDRYKRLSIENKRSALKSLQSKATNEAKKRLKLAQYAQ